ncbi:MAG TPA: UDP-N-acetylglucosamine 2-epimerase (hydrolyzing) [Firmicutes bacterium]|jgi:UDP-hydrolysing UDP-N-acetyl-D-glucosamine 2-epimerase|nr:UDP-N-acetylglucosamine 2-epimerase (hydrolyzing) [Bacillota bacterium]
MKKIAVATGTRAEYGLLYWLLKEIQEDPDLELQLIVTGSHLAPEYGLTYREIERDGFEINEKVSMLVSSDTANGTTKSMGLELIGMADALERLTPDVLVLLGDRYEILAAAEAALIARIPIAHIAGGDTTEGAFDESIRHAVTKMAHLHFVTNQVAWQRVRQLGENPQNIYNVGSPGLDHIKRGRLLTREELASELDLEFLKRNLLITFHPATLDREQATDQFQTLLEALDSLGPELGLFFTKPNSDPGGRALIQMVDQFVAGHANARSYTSLGRFYLSLMAVVDGVVGNSSSGLYEAPSLKKPTVNIGDRQKGRLQAASVINAPVEKLAIQRAIAEAFVKDCTDVVNPYGDGDAARRIHEILKQIPDYHDLLKKHFYEVD